VEVRTNYSKIAKYVGVPLGLFLLVEVAYRMWRSAIGTTVANGVGVVNSNAVDTADLSKLLFRDYLFPFEVTSILVLIAIVGALVLAKRDE
jgi:NADH-quinone oxidoreductase subunit J